MSGTSRPQGVFRRGASAPENYLRCECTDDVVYTAEGYSTHVNLAADSLGEHVTKTLTVDASGETDSSFDIPGMVEGSSQAHLKRVVMGLRARETERGRGLCGIVVFVCCFRGDRLLDHLRRLHGDTLLCETALFLPNG